ncbi:YraN family protein [Microbacterium sp. EYE_5]|uniref:YraN family protein n=1 Tax=unclassified Microbacterium TaxID=2609290 RepID=UPI002004418D|nr:MULTISPECIES: YraN family protein [unclassified Microbacterium]MCK6080858.1 YraN family protein [Microbacterium sp. EYE_382]MCK6086129.1 YraN family protein [Microbacterium sp. EYE_384]MCK6124373.1 YraN family protein [Microbacterium sp. EYE_80]MCK6127282.1 YraN family protein [Microbacterium sp. EYE_79]MCK6141813.1 YraN family protein [Microbacterium sp. EYE_39]
MAAKDDLGRAGEERAARHLEASGYRILDRNWRTHTGEIDIVATRRDELVVVEVKTRRSEWFGHPFAAVQARKRDRLWRLAAAWIVAHPDAARGRRLRLDLIGVTGPEPSTAILEHLEDLR